jgi:hypothetical protein
MTVRKSAAKVVGQVFNRSSTCPWRDGRLKTCPTPCCTFNPPTWQLLCQAPLAFCVALYRSRPSMITDRIASEPRATLPQLRAGSRAIPVPENTRPVVSVGAPMLYKLGRFLQLLGLLVTPVGVAGNLAREDLIDLKTSLAIAAGGATVFFLGWLLQQRARPS